MMIFVLSLLLSSNSTSQSVKFNTDNFSVEYSQTFDSTKNILYLPKYDKIKPKIALALSGGGSRGLSQIGVHSVLLEEGIIPEYIVGTSIGAFIGGLISSGYAPDDLSQIAFNTNWNEFFDLNNDKTRSEYFQDQKIIYDRSLLRLRFDNFKLVIPEGISEGNRFQLYNQKLFLNSVYHTTNSFDKLKYKFRAVATDIAHGKSVSLDKGNIVSAIRASATFPLRNSTVRIDSMILVDGGLFANLPAKAARSLNPDFVIAVDNISPLNPTGDINNPWIIADQVVSILMKNFSDSSRKYADFIIQPSIGNRNNTDFTNLEELISQGRQAAKGLVNEINKSLFQKQISKIDEYLTLEQKNIFVNKSSISTDLKELLVDIYALWDKNYPQINQIELAKFINLIYIANEENERYYNLSLRYDVNGSISISGSVLPIIKNIDLIHRDTSINNWDSDYKQIFIGLNLSSTNLRNICESIIKNYRKNDLPFASIFLIEWDISTANLRIKLNEGFLAEIQFTGNKTISEYLIRRELDFQENHLLKTEDILNSWENLVSSDIIDNAEFTFKKSIENSTTSASIDISERADQMISLGVFLDNERYMQAGLDLIQSNILNSGVRANFRLAGGLRNFLTSFNLTQQRFLNTMITASVTGYYKKQDLHVFGIDPKTHGNRYRTTITNEIREEALGLIASGGYRISRNSVFSGEYRYEKQRYFLTDDTSNVSYSNINTLKFGILYDNENRFGFPTKGRKISIILESSIFQNSEAKSFSKISLSYKGNATFGVHTIRPIFYFGFADKTLPSNEFFNLGGIESFYGLSENEERGRQLFRGSMEYQVKLPFDIFFDTFLTFRYDLGSVWEVPESIKFQSLKHGIGSSVGVNTPIGPAKIAVGEMFYFRKSPNSVIYGYPHLYFSIGVNI
jgi:NTE family protein